MAPKQPVARKQPVAVDGKKMAEKFRKLADGMQKSIDHNTREMTSAWTRKRGSEYNSRLHTGYNDQRTQQALRILADLYEQGKVPDVLQTLRTKSEIGPLVRKGWVTYAGEGHTGPDYVDKSIKGTVLQCLLDARPKTEAEVKAEKARELEQFEKELRDCQIPGFFPTPPALVERILEKVGDVHGLKVLEPSAGKGDIAAAFKEAGADVFCVEISWKLSKFLEARGLVSIQEDFLALPPDPVYDVVAMNPPFEKQQDIAHVTHALKFLKPGGTLVAVMSPSFEHRDSKQAQAFRELLLTKPMSVLIFDEAQFKNAFRTTGVACRLVTIINRPL